MNLDNDYDNDGNNIVPCPICMSNYCPSKEDGKCPEEDMFALEGEIRMLLDEYKATDDNSRIANVLEFVEKLLQAKDAEREKAVESERVRAASIVERMMEDEENWQPIASMILDRAIRKKEDILTPPEDTKK